MGAYALAVLVCAMLGVIGAQIFLDRVGMWRRRVEGKYGRMKTVACWLCGALTVVGFVSLMSWGIGFRQRRDKRMIDTVYLNFHTALHDKDLATAYACMSPDYRKMHTLEEFSKSFEDHGVRWLALEPGRYLKVRGPTAELHPGSDHFPMSGPVYEFVKIGDEWYLTGEYIWSLD